MKEKQPTSKNCFVCGRENPTGLKLDFYMVNEGETRTSFSLPDNYEGYPGMLHGGIIAAILDETGGRALMTDPDRFFVTAQLNIRYRKPVPIETPLIATGIAGEAVGRVAKARSVIEDGDGVLLAEADLILVEVDPTQLSDQDPDKLGWRVYPE
jgi:uncharacterized protein (TIGR00369 family)